MQQQQQWGHAGPSGLASYAPAATQQETITTNGKQHQHPGSSSSASPSGQLLSPMQYSPIHPLAANLPSPNLPTTHVQAGAGGAGGGPHPGQSSTPNSHHSHTLSQLAAMGMAGPNNPTGHGVVVTTATLRDAFLSLDGSGIANLVQSYIASPHHLPSPTPLTAVVEAMFEASCVGSDATTASGSAHAHLQYVGGGAGTARDPHPFVRRYAEMAAYLPPTIVHAGYAGPMAAYRALQMQIRRNSIWEAPGARMHAQSPYQTQGQFQSLGGTHTPTAMGVTGLSISEEMQRIASERQRRRDYIQWARIHAASLELGLMGLVRGGGEMETHAGMGYATGRAFSEMIARDAVWEADEVEWVAGIFVLRAVIRTAISGDRRQKEEYGEILRMYEGRWKEIKDEVRQSMVAVCALFLLVGHLWL